MRAPTLIEAPVKPMLAMWCWPQPFGQPRDLDVDRAGQRILDRERSRRAPASAALSPIELVMPSLQLSVPGQLTTSAIVRGPSPRARARRSARQTS